MSPNYGRNERGHDVAADWLVGGDRKRRVLELLAKRHYDRPSKTRDAGIGAEDIVDRLDCGRSTVYESLRALRDIDALDELADGRFRLSRRTKLGRALRDLLSAISDLTDRPVDRPPRDR